MNLDFVKDASLLDEFINHWNCIVYNMGTGRKLTKKASPDCKLVKIFKSHCLC